jgi:enterochelin esterase-like enzyme
MNNQTIITRIENVLPNPLVVDDKTYILFLISSSVVFGNNVRIVYYEKNKKENKPIDLTYCIDGVSNAYVLYNTAQ